MGPAYFASVNNPWSQNTTNLKTVEGRRAGKWKEIKKSQYICFIYSTYVLIRAELLKRQT